MADLDFTLKRRNGGGYDVLYPTTVINQVTGLQTALDGKVSTTAVGAIGGVASLDGSGKVPIGQLPNAVFDSLFFYSTIGTPGTASAVAINFEEGIKNAATLNRSAVGFYYVLSTAGTIAQQTTSIQTTLGDNLYYQWTFKNDDSGATAPTSSGALEVGDWVVITKITGNGAVGTPYILELAVVNNVYEVATTTTNGIVTLSSSTSTATTGNAVVTNGILNGLLATANTNLNGTTNANKLAPAAHHHNSEYLGISANAVSASKWATARSITLNGDASGSVSIDGSANVTLTVEVVNDSHTHAFANITSKPTTLAGYGITDAQPLDGDLTSIAGLTGTSGLLRKTAANTFTLDTATYLTGNQTITFSNDASGSGTTAIALTLANSGVTAGTYKSVTVDAKGRVTAGTNPTTLSGYGITDAYTQTQVNNLLTNRPEIYYNAAGDSTGDLIIDLDSDGSI
jgi:hypothetical protein